MVEFGLKLADNKVSEWDEYYIAYEKLKDILKKCKKSKQRYEELAKRRPADAIEIHKAYKAGVTKFVTTRTPTQSSNDLHKQQQQQQSSPLPYSSPNRFDTTALENPTESTKLLSTTSPNRLGSSNDSPSIESSTSALTRVITDGVNNYLGSRFERQVRDVLQDIDNKEKEFDECLSFQISNVVNFYYEKLNELKDRLHFLLESVAASTNVTIEEIEATSSQTPQGPTRHRRILSNDSSTLLSQPSVTRTTRTTTAIMDNIVSRFSSIVHAADTRASMSERSIEPMNPVQKIAAAHDDDDYDYDEEDYDDDEDDEFEDEYDKNKKKKSHSQRSHKQKSHANKKHKKKKKMGEVDSIKRAMIDQYRTSKLLLNFVSMNYIGFVKIVKKHDKTLPEYKGKFKEAIHSRNLCHEGRDVEQLIGRLERFFANWFCDGNVREAQAQMLPKRGDALEMDWSQLRLGYRMGMCAVLGVWVAWDCVWGLVADGNSTIGGRAAFPVFRACGGLLLLQWFWGCSVFIWTRFRVNYIYLFDFDPRVVSTPIGIFEEAVDNTLLFLILMLLYYKSGAHDIPQLIPAGGYPFILVLCTIMKLIFPIRTRLHMWHSIWNVISSPLHSPTFFEGYVGDIFTSMVKVFQDVAWTMCWVFSGDFLVPEDLQSEQIAIHAWSKSFWYKNISIPVICLLPLVFRFNQCLRRYIDTGDRFPHLANAFKYAMSQTVTLFGAFHPLYLLHAHRVNDDYKNLFQTFWLVLFISSSLYSFTWDVYMDWGLGRPEYKFLCHSLMYPKRYYYYAVIAIDLVLRFMWVLTLVPPQSGAHFEVPQYLSAVTMMLELFRRTVWGFLRLENEHRSNASGYRRVGFVPLHFNTGHGHQYKEEKQRRGTFVLAEVAVVAIAVVGVCVFSVVAAQRATRFSSLPEL